MARGRRPDSDDVIRLKVALAAVEHMTNCRKNGLAKAESGEEATVNENVERNRRRLLSLGRRVGVRTGTSTVVLNQWARAEIEGMVAHYGARATLAAILDDGKRATGLLRSLHRSWSDQSASPPSPSDLVGAAALAGVQPVERWGERFDRDLLDLVSLATDLGCLVRCEKLTSLATLIRRGHEIALRPLAPEVRAASDILRNTLRAQFYLLAPADNEYGRVIPCVASSAWIAGRADLKVILALMFEATLTEKRSPAAVIAITARLRLESEVPGSGHLFSVAEWVFRDMIKSASSEGDVPPSASRLANLRRAMNGLNHAAKDGRVAMMIEAARVVPIIADGGEVENLSPIELATGILERDGGSRPG
jgi:hypothetical protein